MRQIAFIGVGGVGGYFGGKMTSILSKHQDIKVHFIARGEHLEQIKEKGLCLKTAEGELVCRPSSALAEIEALPLLDACFIAVKAYDLETVVERLKGCIKEDTLIIPLLNGVDIPQRIRRGVSKGTILPACVYVGTHIASPGVVEQNGGSCTIQFGSEGIKPSWLLKLMEEADIHYQWFEKNEMLQAAIWRKYLFIAAHGLVTAVYGKTLGQVYEGKETRQAVLNAIREIAEAGEKEQVKLTEEMVMEAFEKAKQFPYETKTSFQRDYESGRQDERALFSGTLLELAEKHQLVMPTIKRLAKCL